MPRPAGRRCKRSPSTPPRSSEVQPIAPSPLLATSELSSSRRTSGAVLIEGFALAGLAVLEAAVAPASGARAQVEVMAHYLALGNHAHLRGLGRAIIVPLVECGAFEAAAVVDGATRGKAAVLPRLTDAIEEAIDIAEPRARSRL